MPVIQHHTCSTYTSWSQGLVPDARPQYSAHDQSFVAVIVFLMLALCFSIKHIRRVWHTLIRQLWTTRARVDYDHITMSERRTIGLLLIVAIFLIGLITSAALGALNPTLFVFSFPATLRICAVVLAYFIIQYILYWLIGYTFTSDQMRNLWVEGFTATMSLLALALIVPGLGVLFYPDFNKLLVLLAISLYFVARLMFICKGFKIFYTNIGSLVYFILYLCSLEIIPIALYCYIVTLV